MSVTPSRVPVTVLTGFLGSGKTTLLNRILTEKHGKRIAVIENEFGEVGVDSELVIGAEEELFETNNGCICCTVRGDLIRILGQLMKRRDRFDYIIIETTGMADPGPVAQTFFLDDELKNQFALDAIVTMVDAKYFEKHVDELNEPAEQVAFADVVLLNKVDLVEPAALERIERRIRGINGTTKIFRTKNADVAIDKVLNVGAFDLQRALRVDDSFLEPEYPFEWGGVYQLTGGDYLLKAAGEHDHHAHEHGHEHVHDNGDHGHEHADHTHEDLELAVLPLTGATPDALQAAIESAVRMFAEPATVVNCHGTLDAVSGHYAIDISHAGADFTLRVTKPGAYALFMEHHPLEFGLHLAGQRPAAERRFASHHHEDDISSIGISDPRPLDPAKLNQWLDYLLKTRGQDIFRMKGVLNVKGEDRRQVFHGVHMMFDAQPERPWGAAPRENRLVFIGRGLDRAEFEAGFEFRGREELTMIAKKSLSFALEPRATAELDDYVAECAWGPDGGTLAIAGGEGKVARGRYAGDSFTVETIGEHMLGTLAIAWRPRTNQCATSGQDSSIALWDMSTGQQVRRLKPAPMPTQALAYAPDGELLASAAGKSVTLWSPAGDKVHAFAPNATTAVALAFDRPGNDLGVALNGEIAVYRIDKSRYETRRYKWPAACLTVNFSGNGRFLAAGMADGSLHFWNRSTGKDSQMRGYDGKLDQVGWSDNSRYLASCAGNEVVLWDFSGRGPEGTRPIVLSGHTERVDSFAWQPGGEHFVSGGRDWRLTLWRPGKTTQPIDVQLLDSEVSVVRWSQDGKRLLAGDKKGRLTVYELVAR